MTDQIVMGYCYGPGTILSNARWERTSPEGQRIQLSERGTKCRVKTMGESQNESNNSNGNASGSCYAGCWFALFIILSPVLKPVWKKWFIFLSTRVDGYRLLFLLHVKSIVPSPLHPSQSVFWARDHANQQLHHGSCQQLLRQNCH